MPPIATRAGRQSPARRRSPGVEPTVDAREHAAVGGTVGDEQVHGPHRVRLERLVAHGQHEPAARRRVEEGVDVPGLEGPGDRGREAFGDRPVPAAAFHVEGRTRAEAGFRVDHTSEGYRSEDRGHDGEDGGAARPDLVRPVGLEERHVRDRDRELPLPSSRRWTEYRSPVPSSWRPSSSTRHDVSVNSSPERMWTFSIGTRDSATGRLEGGCTEGTRIVRHAAPDAAHAVRVTMSQRREGRARRVTRICDSAEAGRVPTAVRGARRLKCRPDNGDRDRGPSHRPVRCPASARSRPAPEHHCSPELL